MRSLLFLYSAQWWCIRSDIPTDFLRARDRFPDVQGRFDHHLRAHIEILLVATAPAILLSNELPYAVAAALGIAVAAIAGAGYARRNTRGDCVHGPVLFPFMNAALLVGAASYVCGRRYTVWTPTARTRPPRTGGATGVAHVAAGL